MPGLALCRNMHNFANMKKILYILAALCAISCSSGQTTVYDFTAETNEGGEISFSQYKGKVLLIVNTASKCGFTPQYDGLEALYKKYGPEGLVVVGFPCDQFGHQEPGSDEEIEAFCFTKFLIDRKGRVAARFEPVVTPEQLESEIEALL